MGEISVGARLWAAVFPRRCAFCGEVITPERDLCAACAAAPLRVGVPVCPFCGRERDSCDCRRRHRHYERVVAPFYYEHTAREGVLRVKRTAEREALRFFAEEAFDTARQYYDGIAFDGVVYVPVYESFHSEKEFNFGLLVAERVAAKLSLPLWHTLEKICDTPPQKGLLAAERAGNVLGVFQPREGAPLAGKTLLLVDDVHTTGATMDECAKMLKIYGAAAVYGLALALSRKDKKTDCNT